MLKNAMLFAVSSVVLVAFAPAVLPLLKPDTPPRATEPINAETPLVTDRPTPLPYAVLPAQRASDDHEVSIPADPRGQYIADVLLNGQRVRMMIDTGASYVTLSADVADRLGLHALIGEPRGLTQTANGVVEVTPTQLTTVAIGPIFMTDVRAFVLDRRAGAVNLIGTNFLKRLAGVEQRDGWLYLRQ